MNIFNVHVNRAPVSGTISEVRYIPGKFFNASMVEGKKVRQYALGSGPVDAVFNAVCQAVCRKPHLEEFSINAISGGTDAQGEVTVRVREGDATTVGRGVHDDVIMASTLAFVNALNRLANKEDDRTCPRP